MLKLPYYESRQDCSSSDLQSNADLLVLEGCIAQYTNRVDNSFVGWFLLYIRVAIAMRRQLISSILLLLLAVWRSDPTATWEPRTSGQTISTWVRALSSGRTPSPLSSGFMTSAGTTPASTGAGWTSWRPPLGTPSSISRSSVSFNHR